MTSPAVERTGYHGLPLLKRPVWTWEVPAYFLVGGAAGAAAVIAAAARATGAPDGLVRDARWIAAAGGAVSPALLISDLGRPARFLNMLRVFKPQSPMSLGAWTLLVFSNAAAASVLAHTREHRAAQPALIRGARTLAEGVAAASGAVVATYTGVLLGATAIPAWSRHAALLPLHFGASGLATAVSMLELMGHREEGLRRLAIGTSAVEAVIGSVVETDRDPRAAALTRGRSGALVRAGSAMSGAIPLALRVLGRRSRRAGRLAALATIAGAALTRAGWVAAGRGGA